MPTTARTPSTDTFADDGYVELRGFVEPAELIALERLTESALERPHDRSCVRPHNTLVPLRWNDEILDALLASTVRTAAIARAVGATDLRWISGYISVKEPNSAPLWWHQDWWCWEHPISYVRQAPQVAVLCYLSATDTGSGALRLIPASHRKSVALHALLPEAHATGMEGVAPTHAAMRDHPLQVTLLTSGGDAVLVDYRLLHGTHKNSSGHRRTCVILNFAPAWSTLPPEVRGHLIQHPSLPTTDEMPALEWANRLLPSFDGERVDLPLRRDAPASFEAR